LRVTTEVDFDKALDRLESGHFDFVVLDVRPGPHEEEREEEEGIKVLESIKARCFTVERYYSEPRCGRWSRSWGWYRH